MIRTVLALFSFAVAICALIIYKPFADDAPQIVQQDPPAAQEQTETESIGLEVTRSIASNDASLLAEAALENVASVTEISAPTPAPL